MPPGLDPNLIMRLLGPQTAGLLAGAQQMPGIMERPTPTPQAPQVAPQQPGRFQGVTDALGQVFGGSDDPRLSKEQNEQARKQAMMQAGLAGLMASSQSGATLGSTLGHAGLVGQQAGGFAREQVYGATQEERLRQALQNPRIMGRLTEEQQDLIHLLPPQEALEMIRKNAFDKPDPKVVGPDGALVDAEGNELFRNERAPDKFGDLPSEIRAGLFALGVDEANYDNLTPDQRVMAFRLAENFRRSGGTQVNVDSGQRLDRGLTDTQIKQYDKALDSSLKAEEQIGTLSLMEGLLNEGMATGGASAATMPLRSIAAELGVANAENLGQQELFRGLANKMALDMKGEMTGQMSDRDILFLTQQAPQLANTPDGNRRMIDALRRAAQRKMQMAELMDQYIAENGNLRGWNAFRRNWVQENPLYAEFTKSRPWGDD